MIIFLTTITAGIVNLNIKPFWGFSNVIVNLFQIKCRVKFFCISWEMRGKNMLQIAIIYHNKILLNNTKKKL